jgi:ABC-type glycerol-3-phosphate transport system substrate-binding protein
MNPNVLDLEWDGAMQLLLQKKAGSMLMGSWFGGNFKEQSEADYLDLSIIPFPEINPEHGRDTIDAPIDGYCVAANGTNNEGGVDFLKYAGDIEGVNAILGAKDANGASIHTIHSRRNSLLLWQKPSTSLSSLIAILVQTLQAQLLVQQSSHGSRIQRMLQRSKRLCSHSGMHFLL